MVPILQKFGEYVLLAAAGLAWQATADPRGFAWSVGVATLVVLGAWWGQRRLLVQFHTSPPEPSRKARVLSAACGFLSWGCLLAAAGLACLPQAVERGVMVFEQKALRDPVWNREAFVAVTQQVKPSAVAAGEDFSAHPDPVLGGTSFPAQQSVTRELLAAAYARATLEHFAEEGGWLGSWLVLDAGQKEGIVREVSQTAASSMSEGGSIREAPSENPLIAGTMQVTVKNIKIVLLDAFSGYMAFKRGWLWMWALLLQILPFVIRLRAAAADIKVIP